ncbi:MAG: glycosyltransferase family 2 protein [Alphaproteobacteria bacterium]|nr:glycosyltransferase family 2 protein [Alphaproteobacteria bacterium]MBU2083320.1 glycosyltransferase family 2 protein [Alphaproteobacteria bacterium]MBU2143715.1 glycosyltransferase family 2 protein [Alphaproteobacteria bacterium]MBU2195604.1 glycosyltransferase family 2 protein [Alphaproteobacteria bacterium]
MESRVIPLEKPNSRIDASQVLAVIPALNEARHIETCIRSLMTGDAWLRSVPLVVVDGGSTDGTAEIVEALIKEFPNLRILYNPERFQSAAVNQAVTECAGPEARFLVRCDAHSVFPQDFILSVTSALIRTGAASVVIPMDAQGETCFEKANAWIVDTPLGSGGSAHRGGRQSGYVDHGHHAGFDLTMFRSLGGYDGAFSHNEDAEYDERVAQAGGQIFLDATIRKIYIPRGTVGALAKQYFNYGKGRARTIFKHGQRPKIRQMLPVLALLGSLTGLIAFPFFAPALILPAAYFAILLTASILVCTVKRSPCGLLAGVASGTMHMSWAAGFIKQSLVGPR